MRFILFVICGVASICFAQETYRNEEFGFTIDVPSNWYINFDKEWPVEVKTALKQKHAGKFLFMLNPLGVKASDSPCVRVLGGLGTSKINFRAAYIKKNGKRMLTSSLKHMADELLGSNIKQYHEVDTFYENDPSRQLAIAKILYKQNDPNTYFMVTSAKFYGRPRSVNFQGYWSGVEHEDFWQVFTEVIGSYKFDKYSITIDFPLFDKDADPKEKVFILWKWAGIILTISIAIGILRMLFFRD
ncbi:MAG: hypothetical protein H8E17_09180 [Deltaproteobacteria bacterium]|nr:hypothetical protein [Deltaproteobacteria bacterium]